MGAITTFVVGKLKEGSTWSGIAAIIAGASFIPHAAEIGALVPAIGTVVAGTLSIWFK
jgi:hypothetical protein